MRGMRGKRNFWEEWEKDFVISNYEKMNNNTLSQTVDKDPEQVSNFLHRGGLTREGSLAEKNKKLRNLYAGWEIEHGCAV